MNAESTMRKEGAKVKGITEHEIQSFILKTLVQDNPAQMNRI